VNGFALTGFFYNPNIQPREEYERRWQAMNQFSEAVGLEMIYQPEPRSLAGSCSDCYRTRLRATAQKARELGFSFFTTTLLISPYQQHDLIKRLGEEASAEFKVEFYYQDFRPLFRQGQNTAREMNLYMQKYCGCGRDLVARRSKEYAEVS
jgi:predicted adenine nucleotide alpha hydrolase (AANH) superfamily ATPase